MNAAKGAIMDTSNTLAAYQLLSLFIRFMCRVNDGRAVNDGKASS